MLQRKYWLSVLLILGEGDLNVHTCKPSLSRLQGQRLSHEWIDWLADRWPYLPGFAVKPVKTLKRTQYFYWILLRLCWCAHFEVLIMKSHYILNWNFNASINFKSTSADSSTAFSLYTSTDNCCQCLYTNWHFNYLQYTHFTVSGTSAEMSVAVIVHSSADAFQLLASQRLRLTVKMLLVHMHLLRLQLLSLLKHPLTVQLLPVLTLQLLNGLAIFSDYKETDDSTGLVA